MEPVSGYTMSVRTGFSQQVSRSQGNSLTGRKYYTINDIPHSAIPGCWFCSHIARGVLLGNFPRPRQCRAEREQGQSDATPFCACRPRGAHVILGTSAVLPPGLYRPRSAQCPPTLPSVMRMKTALHAESGISCPAKAAGYNVDLRLPLDSCLVVRLVMDSPVPHHAQEVERREDWIKDDEKERRRCVQESMSGAEPPIGKTAVM